MKIKSIASSSDGNCTYIYTDKAAILIDSGIAIKNISPHITNKLDAIFITHEHSDHIKSTPAIGRKYKIPIYIHKECYKKLEYEEWFEKFAYDKKQDKNKRKPKFDKCSVIYVEPSKTYEVGDLKITPFSTPHDAAYSLGYIIEDTTTNKKLGYLTDCGSFTKLMEMYLSNCDGYLIETDYDEELLDEFDRYDEFLKDRIRSSVGHLSNKQTFDFLEKLGIDKTEFVVFCHLSKRTNSPELVLKQASERFPNYSKFYTAPVEFELNL